MTNVIDNKTRESILSNMYKNKKPKTKLLECCEHDVEFSQIKIELHFQDTNINKESVYIYFIEEDIFTTVFISKIHDIIKEYKPDLFTIKIKKECKIATLCMDGQTLLYLQFGNSYIYSLKIDAINNLHFRLGLHIINETSKINELNEITN